MGLQREPISQEWFDGSGAKVAYHEIWHDQRTRDNYANGHRLVVRKDALCSYLKTIGFDMIFSVRLSRCRPYDYSRNSDDSYDPGKRQFYLLTSNGQLKLIKI
jgi:hypothetical protein